MPTDGIEPSVRDLARRCTTAAEFAERLGAGEAIAKGSAIIADDLPYGGWVVGQATLGSKKKPIPAWKIKLPDGGRGVLLKERACHMHGLAVCEGMFKYLKGA